MIITCSTCGHSGEDGLPNNEPGAYGHDCYWVFRERGMSYARSRGRVDGNQEELVRFARRLGIHVELLGGKVDCAMVIRGRVLLCDFKMPRGRRTETQKRMDAAGVPIHYLTSEADILKLLKRRAA